MSKLPEHIGRYTIEKLLGEGAMGSVYKAHDPVIQRIVAIKTIKTDIIEETVERKEFKRRFFNEAQICGSLHHPNIVVLYDLGEEQNTPFIAMEYLEGRTLQQHSKSNKKMDIDTKVQIIMQIADALDYAHERDIIHRDIKPQNIMVTDAHIAKIMDFGIAKIGDEHMTKTGFFVGTPSYSSPEQIAGEKVDYRSDIFSLGVLAHELLTGKLPFPGKSISSILYQVVNGQPSLEYVPPEIDANKLQFKLIFLKALNKDREKRYQHASELAEELRRLVGTAERSIPHPTAENPVVSTQAFGKPYLSDGDNMTQTSERVAMNTQTHEAPAQDFSPVSGLTKTDVKQVPPTQKITPAGSAISPPTHKIDPPVAYSPQPVRPQGASQPLTSGHLAQDPVISAKSQTQKSYTGLYAALAAVAVAAVLTVWFMRGADDDDLDPIPELPVTNRSLVLQSEPSGAKVWINDRDQGQTPLNHEFDIAAKDRFELRFEFEGYESTSHVLLANEDWGSKYLARLTKTREIEKPIETTNDEPDPEVIVDKGLSPEEIRRREALDREIQDQIAWREASSRPSVASFENYLDTYPNGAFSALAKNERDHLLEQQAYDNVKRSNNLKEVETFLANYPSSQWAPSMEDRLNQLKTASAFQKAMLSNEPERLTEFLSQYRTWATVDQVSKVESKLNAANNAVHVEDEAEAYAKAKVSSNLPTLKQYLQNYNNTDANHVNEIQNRIFNIDQEYKTFLSSNFEHDRERKYKVTKDNEAFSVSMRLTKTPNFKIKRVNLVWSIDSDLPSETQMIGAGNQFTAQIPHGSLRDGEFQYHFAVEEESGQVYQLPSKRYSTKITVSDAPKNLVITY